MSNSISSVLSVIPFECEKSASNPPRVQPSAAANNDSPDTVLLSETQSVYQLCRRGESVAQIASRLGLSEAAVDSYLAAAA
jgi:DNA-binding NarL/FixJ family response regulator